MMGRTDTLVKEAKEILEWDILKFWAGMQDPKGGFYGEIAKSGTADKESVREEQLNARILWAYSNAFRIFKKREYLMSAINAKDYFLEHFLDHKYGGTYTSVDSWGEKLDTDAHLSNQALAIYALSEFFGATKEDETLKQTINLFKIIEKEFYDNENGGYYETLNRDFSMKDDSKKAVSHVYLLEAYSNLYRVWKDESLRKVISSLIDVIVTKFFNQQTGHLEPVLTKDWQVIPAGCGFGLDLEASWSVFDAAYAIEDIDEINKVKSMTASLYKAGMEGLQDGGYVAYAKNAEGVVDTKMEPWVQSEALIANLCAWKYQNIPEGVEEAFKLWDYIKTHLNDTVDTIAFRMYPMHDTRVCIHILNIFR